MHTKLTTSPKTASELILQNELVAFPTETVYGLGANAFESEAVKKIFIAKGRPSDNPLIVHVASLDQVPSVVSSIPRLAEKLMEKFFPGPLTIVLPKNKKISPHVTAGLSTVGVRIPKSKIAHQFLTECGVPVAAPSANLSGKPSPTTWKAVQQDLKGRIACILKGDSTEIGVESTVVDCAGSSPVILRAGGVSLERLREVIPSVRVAKHFSHSPVKSPGVKYRHYSPLAYVFIVSGMEETVPTKSSAYIGMSRSSDSASTGFLKAERNSKRGRFGFKKICRSPEEYARSLFHFFRECDDKKIETIYCEQVSEDGIGLALMDRIRKAAVQ